MWRKYTKLIGLCLRCLGKSEMEMAVETLYFQADMTILAHKIAVNKLTNRLETVIKADHKKPFLTDEEKRDLTEQAVLNIAIVDEEARQILAAVGTVQNAMTTETTRTTEETDG